MQIIQVYRQIFGSAIRLRPHLRGGRWLIGAVVATSVLSSALEGVGVGLLVPLLSLLLGGENAPPMRPLAWLHEAWPAKLPTHYVLALCAIIIFAIAAKNVVLYACHVLAARLKRRVSTHLREALHTRMLHADFDVLDRRTAGEMANVFTTESYRTMLALDYLLMLLQRGCMAVFYLTGLCLISWELLAITIVAGTALGLSHSRLYHSIGRAGQRLTDANQALAGRLTQTFAGIRVIRATHGEESDGRRFRAANDAQAAADEATARVGHVFAPLTETAAVLGAMLIIAVAYLFLVTPGRMLPSHLLGYGFILLRLIPLVNQMHAIQGNLANLSGSVREVERWLETPLHPHRPFGTSPLAQVQQGLRFNHVSFSYLPGTEVLSDVTFECRTGKTTAVVGPSGSGKSTLASLLLRFREPQQGQIQIDGRDIWEFDPAAWHRAVAIVEQEAFLFHDSVLNNICFACPQATRQDALRAAERAHLDDVIATLPEGLDTVVGECGALLSGGQRQRVAIARALVRDPKILILDEATSALDSISEQQVQAALNEAAVGRTVVVIAHRLSTIRHADWIVVLNQGRVEEQGSWATLERNGRLFTRLTANVEHPVTVQPESPIGLT